jgi:hypothetical protein
MHRRQVEEKNKQQQQKIANERELERQRLKQEKEQKAELEPRQRLDAWSEQRLEQRAREEQERQLDEEEEEEQVRVNDVQQAITNMDKLLNIFEDLEYTWPDLETPFESVDEKVMKQIEQIVSEEEDVGYAYDLRLFLKYCDIHGKLFKYRIATDFLDNGMNALTREDMSYIAHYDIPVKEIINIRSVKKILFDNFSKYGIVSNYDEFGQNIDTNEKFSPGPYGLSYDRKDRRGYYKADAIEKHLDFSNDGFDDNGHYNCDERGLFMYGNQLYFQDNDGNTKVIDSDHRYNDDANALFRIY